jgi:hypothetical protein
LGTQTIGVIKVENKRRAPQAHFSQEELHSLEILASNIALALNSLNWQREMFWKGEAARALTHDLRADMQLIKFHIESSVSKLATLAPSTTMDLVREKLEIARRAVAEFEHKRERAMADTPADHQPTTCDVNSLLQVLAQHSGWIVADKRIQLIQTPPEGPIYVNVDREQILRALSNLVMNATEALQQTKDPQIKVEVQHMVDDKEVSISVTDNGPGLSQAQRDEFLIHHKIHSPKPFAIGGAGIKEASRCCSDNGGRLELLESQGRGTAFRVVLTTCSPRRLRLAIIDDEQNILNTFRTELDRRDDIVAEYITSPVCLTAQGPQDIDPNGFDFILLDCWFTNTGANGVDLYRELKGRNSALSKKIILMSGDDQYIQSQPVKIYHKFTDILNRIDEFIANMHSRQV